MKLKLKKKEEIYLNYKHLALLLTVLDRLKPKLNQQLNHKKFKMRQLFSKQNVSHKLLKSMQI
jgi:hypothetical protein